MLDVNGMVISINQFAAVYGCGAYSAGNYSTNATCTTTTGNGSTSGGTLPSTGENIIYGLVGGTLLIVLAIVLFVSSRRKNRK